MNCDQLDYVFFATKNVKIGKSYLNEVCFKNIFSLNHGFLQVDYSLKANYSYDLTNKFTLSEYQQVFCGLEKLRLKNKGFLHCLFIFL